MAIVRITKQVFLIVNASGPQGADCVKVKEIFFKKQCRLAVQYLFLLFIFDTVGYML